MKKLTLVLLAMMTVFVSCNKDADDPSGSTSRTILYEITGNFTGTTVVSYTTASGGTANEQIPSIPWSKEITYATNVTAAIISVTGSGGVQGQQITIKRKRGNSQLPATNVPTEPSGGFSQAASVIVF